MNRIFVQSWTLIVPLFRKTAGLIRLFVFSVLITCCYRTEATIELPALTWTQRSDWLNVKSAPYNAVGDGVADDTDAIQAALTAAGACNSSGTPNGVNRTVYLPPGTYKISRTLDWKGTNTPWTYGGNGLQLIGCGRDTRIIWAGASGGAMFLSQGATSTNYIGIIWDGNNLAGTAYLHNPTIHFEDPVRHENEAFYNFTVNGTYVSGTSYPAAGIMNGLANSTVFSADVLIWNCLFNNCTYGLIVGNNVANNYQWCIESCQFEQCGTGVKTPCGMTTIFDCHFEGSANVDIETSPSLAQSIRSCTSVSSKAFLKVGQAAGYGEQKVQDCRIDSWTSTVSAIQLDGCGPTLITDCVFTNPPNTVPPIRMNNNQYGTNTLLTSNNYCPSTCTALVAPSAYSRMVDIPPGNLLGPVATLSSANKTFLQPTNISNSANIIDITGPGYNADKTCVADSTVAIQNAINAARTAGNGAIVYFPCGKYKVTSMLTVTGSNYTLQGSGFQSVLKWGGATSGTMISITSPQNISLEQFNLASVNTVAAIVQSGTVAGDIVYDGIQKTLVDSVSRDTMGPGVQLVSLPAGSRVYIGHMLAPLTVNDCGPAEIFGRYIENGRLIVKGATRAKSGFLGISNSMQGGKGGADDWDILVDDNQDLVIGHLYQEQNYNHLKLNRGAGTWSGQVTIQGVKQNLQAGYTSILANNYLGRLTYGPTFFANLQSTVITHTGTNALDFILPGCLFKTTTPTITTDVGCRLITTMNVYSTSPVTFPADVMPTGADRSIANGLDHLRRLFAEDLKLIHGIQNPVKNSFFETDTLNPTPLTAMGTYPASWTIVGGTAVGSGVRSVSAVSGGSPFGAGTQSVNLVDTTGTNIGGRLEMNQVITGLPSTAPTVFSFDVRINSMTPIYDDIWLTLFSGTLKVLNMHLICTGTTGSFGPATLARDTWYRIRAVIPAPSLGPVNSTLYVTPWTANGPGTTTTYSVTSPLTAASAQGITKIFWNTLAAGQRTNVNFDNMTLVTGDPLIP